MLDVCLSKDQNDNNFKKVVNMELLKKALLEFNKKDKEIILKEKKSNRKICKQKESKKTEEIIPIVVVKDSSGNDEVRMTKLINGNYIVQSITTICDGALDAHGYKDIEVIVSGDIKYETSAIVDKCLRPLSYTTKPIIVKFDRSLDQNPLIIHKNKKDESLKLAVLNNYIGRIVEVDRL